MRKILAVIVLTTLSVTAMAQAPQVVDPKFDKTNCTSYTGGVGGATTSYGTCEPVIVKQEVVVPGPVQIKEVPVPVVVPAPVQKKRIRE